MSFIAKNPLSAPVISKSPPSPPAGARGLFATEDGWYDIDDTGNVTKLTNTSGDGSYDDSEIKQSIVELKENKVDKVEGKALSTNDFTDEYKQKVENALQSFEETDPTVPEWAKQPQKPAYTAEEVGALPDDTEIPSIEGLATQMYVDNKISEIEIPEIDLSGYATEEYVDDAVKDWELVASYTHDGNRKIQPTAVDLTTGYFTCENHGLVEDEALLVLENIDYYNTTNVYILHELISKAAGSREFCAPKLVTVIDENTFALKKSNGTIYTYPSTKNTTADVTKFYFETTDGGIFSGFTDLGIDMRNYDVMTVAKNPYARISLSLTSSQQANVLVNPYASEGGMGLGIPVTPVRGISSEGRATWSFDGSRLFVDVKSCSRWLSTGSYLTSQYVTESYAYAPLLPANNEAFCANPIIDKLMINTYGVDQNNCMRNGGCLEIWKKRK